MHILCYHYIINLFQDASERSALHSAVLAGNTAIIPELHHLSPNILDSNGSTPVHLGTKF